MEGSKYMGESIYGLKRTHMCAELTVNDVGKTLRLWMVPQKQESWWVNFCYIKRQNGIIQVVFDNTVNSELFAKAEGIRGEYVLAVVEKW